MTLVSQLTLAATLAVGLSGSALAQSKQPSNPPHAVHEHKAKPGDAASTRDFKAAHKQMMREMAISYSGMTDVDFVRGMIPHHQGAIDMAKVELKHGKDPVIRALAEKIIADQEKEIAQMQDWLKKNAR